MAKFSIKKVSNSAKIPEIEDGVFVLNSDMVSNTAVQPGGVLEVKTGISVTIPARHIGIVTLSSEFMGPATSLVLAEGIKFLRAGETKGISVRVVNTGTTTRVVRNHEAVAELVIIPITEFGATKKEDGEDA